MPISANAYGTLAGVASRTPAYANASLTFDATTIPTASQVEGWINQVSSLLNAVLAENGFVVPVTAASVTDALAGFVEEEVGMMALAANGVGRFGLAAQNPESRRGLLIRLDALDFVGSQAHGFEAMGATRQQQTVLSISFRDTDERGNATFPLFQRDMVAGTFQDYDRSD